MRTAPHRVRAFTLLESLIAVTILGMAIVVFTTWIWQAWGAEKRIEVHRLALRELEAQNEALRATGSSPVTITSRELPPLTDLSRLDGAVVEASGVAKTPPGLYEITLRVRYQLAGQEFVRTMTTLTWQP